MRLLPRLARLRWALAIPTLLFGIGTLLGGGCGWDYAVEAVVEDATSDGTSDVAPEAYTLPDGRVCTGHDEDGDGVPDACDNCPNVKNPTQTGGTIGDACVAGDAFIKAPAATRLLFDPFRSLSSWKSVGTGTSLLAEAPDGDSFTGGTTADADLRYVFNKIGAGAGAIVLTTELVLLEEAGGSAGIQLRMTADFRFYVCAVSLVNGFVAARSPDTGCTGGPCGPLAFTMPSGGTGPPVAAQLPIPKDVLPKPGESIGVRASITSAAAFGADGGPTTADFECRVFNPRDPSTLLKKDAAYAVKVSIGAAKLLPSGEVGLYAQKAKATFKSVDVLTGP